jgi:hypothetical protein
MTPEDVRLVVAGGDEFSVVCRSLPHSHALKVVDGTVEVVSEGHWKLFTRSAVATESGY